MKRLRIHLIFTAFACLLFLSGCVNLVQEMTVDEDGTGTLRFALGVETAFYPDVQAAIPESYRMQNLLSSMIQDEYVTNVTQEQYEADGRTWDMIQLDVSDIYAMFDEERRIGPLLVSIDEDNGTFIFNQIIDLDSAPVSIAGVNLLDLTGAGYEVRLITPQIINTNGLQTAAGVSVWDVPLNEFLQEGETIILRSEFGLEPYEGVFIPWESFFPYIVTGFLALGVLAILVVIVVNTTRKNEPDGKIQF